MLYETYRNMNKAYYHSHLYNSAAIRIMYHILGISMLTHNIL